MPVRCLMEAFHMSVELNHTIIHSRDRQASAEFLADILGLKVGTPWGPFLPVETANRVTLDFATVGPDETVTPQHYAFLIDRPAGRRRARRPARRASATRRGAVR